MKKVKVLVETKEVPHEVEKVPDENEKMLDWK